MTVLMLQYELEDAAGVRARLLPDRSLADEPTCVYAWPAWEMLKEQLAPDGFRPALSRRGFLFCSRLRVLNGGDLAAVLWLPHHELNDGPRRNWRTAHGVRDIESMNMVRKALRRYEREDADPPDLVLPVHWFAGWSSRTPADCRAVMEAA